MHRLLFVLVLLAIAFTTAQLSTAADARKKMVLIAGKKSHGPEGNRVHDYAWSVRLLKALFDESSIIRYELDNMRLLSDTP